MNSNSMNITKLLLGASLTLSCCMADPGPVWTDPVKAAAESPDFLIQGEYLGEGRGVQVVAMGKGQFLVSEYAGGLPGAGWDGKEIKQSKVDADGVPGALAGAVKTQRKPASVGAEPPEGALVLFDGSNADQWKGGQLVDGFLKEGTSSKKEFGDFKMHLEFRLPFKPEVPLSNQDRGNSGIYIFGRYECQVIDSFGLDYGQESELFERASDPKQWCGSLYKFKTPDVPMCLPPLEWQSYDIEFTAPVYVDGKKTENARLTLALNGVKIHDDVELPKGTGNGGKKPEVPAGPIYLQGHGNPVAFRNIWVIGK